MTRRTKSVIKAHDEAFNHYVTLKSGTDLNKWRKWLVNSYGEVKGTAEGMKMDRWSMIGASIGFHDIEDAERFIVAANDDLMRKQRLFRW